MCVCVCICICICIDIWISIHMDTAYPSIEMAMERGRAWFLATDARFRPPTPCELPWRRQRGARIFQRGNVGRFYGSIYCVNRLVQRHHLNPDISDYIFPSTAEAEEVKAPYKEPDEARLSETWAGSWQKLKKELAMGGGSLEHWCFSRWCVGFWIAWTWAIWLLCRSWHVAHARLCSTEGGLIAFVTTLRQDLAVVADMLHIAAYAQQGWWGGLITFLTPFRGTCCRRCWNVAHARLCSKGGVEGW